MGYDGGRLPGQLDPSRQMGDGKWWLVQMATCSLQLSWCLVFLMPQEGAHAKLLIIRCRAYREEGHQQAHYNRPGDGRASRSYAEVVAQPWQFLTRGPCFGRVTTMSFQEDWVRVRAAWMANCLWVYPLEGKAD